MALVERIAKVTPEELALFEAEEALKRCQKIDAMMGAIAYFCASFGLPDEVEEHMRKEAQKISDKDFGQMEACLQGAAETFVDDAEGESVLAWPGAESALPDQHSLAGITPDPTDEPSPADYIAEETAEDSQPAEGAQTSEEDRDAAVNLVNEKEKSATDLLQNEEISLSEISALEESGAAVEMMYRLASRAYTERESEHVAATRASRYESFIKRVNKDSDNPSTVEGDHLHSMLVYYMEHSKGTMVGRVVNGACVVAYLRGANMKDIVPIRTLTKPGATTADAHNAVSAVISKVQQWVAERSQGLQLDRADHVIVSNQEPANPAQTAVDELETVIDARPTARFHEVRLDDEPAHVQLAHKWSMHLNLDESLSSALVSFFDPKSGANLSENKEEAARVVRSALLKDGCLRDDLKLSPQETRHIRKMLGIYIRNDKPQLIAPCTMGMYLAEQRRKNPEHKVKVIEQGVYEAFLSALSQVSQKGYGESVASEQARKIDIEIVSDSAEVLNRLGEKLGLTEAESFALYQRALVGTGAYREMSDATIEALGTVQARMTQFSRDDFKTETQLKVLRGFTRTVLGGPMNLDEIAKELKIEDGAQGVERILIEAMRVIG